MTGAIRVMPWPDPVLDAIGHDPRSWYVETFWLPTLGPTALLLLRHLADRFEPNPKGVDLPVADTAAALGLGPARASSRRSSAASPGCSSSSSPAPTATSPSRCARRCRPCTGATCAGCRRACRRVTRNGSRSRRRSRSTSRGGAPAGSRSRCSRRTSRSTPSNARCTPAGSIPRSRTKPCAGRAGADLGRRIDERRRFRGPVTGSRAEAS